MVDQKDAGHWAQDLVSLVEFLHVEVEEKREMFETPMIGRRMFSRGSLVAIPWFTLLPLLVLQGQAVHTGWPGGGGGQHGHTPKVRRRRKKG